jgi:hypothetical protein
MLIITIAGNAAVLALLYFVSGLYTKTWRGKP